VLIVSVDPGLSGAVAFLGDDFARVVDLPTVDLPGEGTVRRRVHGPGLQQLLLANIPEGEDDIHFVIEGLSVGGFRPRPGERQGSSAQTVGSQYRTRGTIECLAECLGLEVHEVYPVSWKRFYGLVGKQRVEGEDEAAKARHIACELYPALEPFLKRVKDHNRAEAVLIGNWFRKVKL
jgi:hypothetical protein